MRRSKYFYAKHILATALCLVDRNDKLEVKEVRDALHYAIVGDYDKVTSYYRRRWDNQIIFTKFFEGGNENMIFSYAKEEPEED